MIKRLLCGTVWFGSLCALSLILAELSLSETLVFLGIVLLIIIGAKCGRIAFN